MIVKYLLQAALAAAMILAANTYFQPARHFNEAMATIAEAL